MYNSSPFPIYSHDSTKRCLHPCLSEAVSVSLLDRWIAQPSQTQEAQMGAWRSPPRAEARTAWTHRVAGMVALLEVLVQEQEDQEIGCPWVGSLCCPQHFHLVGLFHVWSCKMAQVFFQQKREGSARSWGCLKLHRTWWVMSFTFKKYLLVTIAPIPGLEPSQKNW